jgi:hypothetical protein
MSVTKTISTTKPTKPVAIYDIKGDLNSNNIIEGKRKQKPKQQAYTTSLEHLD